MRRQIYRTSDGSGDEMRSLIDREEDGYAGEMRLQFRLFESSFEFYGGEAKKRISPDASGANASAPAAQLRSLGVFLAPTAYGKWNFRVMGVSRSFLK